MHIELQSEKMHNSNIELEIQDSHVELAKHNTNQS